MTDNNCLVGGSVTSTLCGRAGMRACGRAGVRACGRAGERACGRAGVRACGVRVSACSYAPLSMLHPAQQWRITRISDVCAPPTKFKIKHFYFVLTNNANAVSELLPIITLPRPTSNNRRWMFPLCKVTAHRRRTVLRRCTLSLRALWILPGGVGRGMRLWPRGLLVRTNRISLIVQNVNTVSMHVDCITY